MYPQSAHCSRGFKGDWGWRGGTFEGEFGGEVDGIAVQDVTGDDGHGARISAARTAGCTVMADWLGMLAEQLAMMS